MDFPIPQYIKEMVWSETKIEALYYGYSFERTNHMYFVKLLKIKLYQQLCYNRGEV